MSRNIFIYGLSGSGKDTVSNYLRDSHGYLKLRIAGTIKQYVFETYGFKNQEEFEQHKRNNPEVRTAHNTFGKQYDQEGLDRSDREATHNRIVSLTDRTALEFEICPEMQTKPICIVDVRNFLEATLLLEKGFYGIFLNRTTTEYADKSHKTEQNMYLNGEVNLILNNLKTNNDICLIFNESKQYDKDFIDYIQTTIKNNCPEEINPLAYVTKGFPEVLLILVKNIVLCNFESKLIMEKSSLEINNCMKNMIPNYSIPIVKDIDKIDKKY